MMNLWLLVALLLYARVGWAEAGLSPVETWFDASFSLTGSSGERFGSSMACSGPVGSTAYIAIGAPDYSGAHGRVLIYSSNDLTAPVQTIYSTSPAAGSRFGAAVSFTNDINSDGIADLVITEPRPNGFNASVYIYLSQFGSTPYTLCGGINMASGNATEVLPLTVSSSVSPTTAHVVVGNPSAANIGAVTIGNMLGACSLFMSANYAASASGSSMFGNTLAEIKSTNATESDVLVGSPNENSGGGRVAAVEQLGNVFDVQSGIMSQGLGTNVAGNPVSGHFGYTIPDSDVLRLFLSNGTGQYSPVCNVSSDMSDMQTTWGRSLRLLDSSFASFLGGSAQSAVYAMYKTQIATGGSVALVSTLSSGGCGSPREFNNCVFDVNQEQGRVLAGGSTCTINVNGTYTPMLLVGSPGWNNGAGRVDIVIEGTQLSSAKVCGSQSPVETPDPTATLQPLPTAPVETPIPVGSGSVGLPAPAIASIGAKSAVIVLPQVEAGESFANFLKRKLKISLLEARKLARSATLTYEVAFTPTTRASSAELSAMAAGAKLQKVRTRKQRVTVSRLTPGTTYRVTWRVEITIRRPKKSFFTKSSAPTSLTTSR